MTELAEGVALGQVQPAEIDCPFHDKRHSCDNARNSLEGDAAELGEAVVAGNDATSTVVRQARPDIDYKRELHQEDDPDERPFGQREIQLVRGDDATWYPTGFQAHHLIPAKESLARAKLLLSFMRAGKKACCPIGYNVNGNQNGAWLPGKHTVDGNGLDLWKGSTKKGPENELAGRKRVQKGKGPDKCSYVELTGHRPGHPQAFEKSNMRWLYVSKSMHSLGTRQFHDRHPTYSRHVLNHLNALAAVLERLAGSNKKKAGCTECRNTNEGERKPPIALLGALNGLSSHYRKKVMNRIQHSQFYTSSWCDPARKSLANAKRGASSINHASRK